MIHVGRNAKNLSSLSYPNQTNDFYYGKSDANATIQIWNRLLKNTREIYNVTGIFLSGDTGSGFRSVKLSWFYTTWVSNYQVKPHVHHLCPHHAYNLCDSHGQHVVQQEKIARAEGQIFVAGSDYAHLVAYNCLLVRPGKPR
jgi:hypothetical protein